MKLNPNEFALFLGACADRHDGYIMGAVGQNPKELHEWYFNQYKDRKTYTAKQEAKALYWRAHARFVWDCNGLAEGIYEKFSGVNINTKARYAYADRCGAQGKGTIPAERRVPGAAVYWGSKASAIHHVAYLDRPVVPGEPGGDWYLIEARGVLYGCVRTTLSARKPDFWGWMDKYFDYAAAPADASVVISGGDCWIRAAPGTHGRKLGVAKAGTVLPYAGETASNGWLRTEKGWVSGKYAALREVNADVG